MEQTSTYIEILTRSSELPDLADAEQLTWKIQVPNRDLDSNIVTLQPAASIGLHKNDEVDVQLYIISGGGVIGSAVATGVPVNSGDVVWLPKGVSRFIEAGPQGLRYLSTHIRKHNPGLTIGRQRLVE